nr:unnamed protein product [Digitaria exilis]
MVTSGGTATTPPTPLREIDEAAGRRCGEWRFRAPARVEKRGALMVSAASSLLPNESQPGRNHMAKEVYRVPKKRLKAKPSSPSGCVMSRTRRSLCRVLFGIALCYYRIPDWDTAQNTAHGHLDVTNVGHRALLLKATRAKAVASLSLYTHHATSVIDRSSLLLFHACISIEFIISVQISSNAIVVSDRKDACHAEAQEEATGHHRTSTAQCPPVICCVEPSRDMPANYDAWLERAAQAAQKREKDEVPLPPPRHRLIQLAPSDPHNHSRCLPRLRYPLCAATVVAERLRTVAASITACADAVERLHAPPPAPALRVFTNGLDASRVL